MDIKTAIKIISFYHKDQKYGDHMPYFLHPVEVANEVLDPTYDEYLAALMHDLLEDCNLTESTLRAIASKEVVDMVVLLTKDKSLTYEENVQRIIDSGNIGAMKVKLADNTVNMRGDKSKMSQSRKEKLETRYQRSIEMLTKALETK